MDHPAEKAKAFSARAGKVTKRIQLAKSFITQKMDSSESSSKSSESSMMSENESMGEEEDSQGTLRSSQGIPFEEELAEIIEPILEDPDANPFHEPPIPEKFLNNDFFPEEAPPMEPPSEEPHPIKGRGPVKTTWMFTVNNYKDRDIELLQLLGQNECVYMCMGKEIAPTTGTPHLQGFCILKRKQYYTYFKSVIGKQCWPLFERVRGSPEANKKYCSKTRVQVIG